MLAIFVAILMILSALVIALPGMQGREYGIHPAASASSQGNIQPDPLLNTNVTWSTFNAGWNPLEYSNGTANLTLNAELSSLYANPISVNPAHIIYASNSTWMNASLFATRVFNTGIGTVISTPTKTTYEGVPAIEATVNTSAAATNIGVLDIQIPLTDMPSNNLAYDYVTAAGIATGKSLPTGSGVFLGTNNATGVNINLVSQNATGLHETHTPTTGNTGQPFYMSVSLTQLETLISGTDEQNYNFSGAGAATHITVSIRIDLPQEASTTYTLYMTQVMLSESPEYPGLHNFGNSTSALTNSMGIQTLTALSPDFAYKQITENGYSVAVSQPLQNLTISQAAISSGDYIEQVEYQGEFVLPSAPDLSYGPANITEYFNLSTSQTQVLDINGASYLSSIASKNGTITLLTTANPNQPTQFLQIVDYTESQWTSISSPPGIFSLAGLEYYWEELIIAILAIVGIGGGAAAKHASNLRKVK